jgi:signal transduction histidine kinase
VRLSNAHDLRPLAEPIADMVTAVVILVAGAVAGIVFRLLGARAGIPLLELSTTFAAVVTAALAWPAAMTARHRWLARRYGPGTLSTDDVAKITADLHQRAEPREVLGKAAEMVATSSGLPDASIVLGQDHNEVQRGWIEHPLVVGGHRVGSLLVRSEDPDGPEQRQRRIVERLLPTVSLVCLAVTLAVDAEHARRDLARERDHERVRILGDLHDGLGPVLAGMSMRVEAELGRNPTPALEALAQGLAESRGDLRRIVAGLAPSALDGIDLVTALERLVSSFRGNGHRVLLATEIPQPLSDPLEVAVYRSVAEGVTNALRHGRAGMVTVSVTAAADGRVHVQVDDDGTAGTIVPGVGLTSLRRRAEALGGSMLIECPPNGGTRLRVDFLSAGST